MKKILTIVFTAFFVFSLIPQNVCAKEGDSTLAFVTQTNKMTGNVTESGEWINHFNIDKNEIDSGVYGKGTYTLDKDGTLEIYGEGIYGANYELYTNSIIGLFIDEYSENFGKDTLRGANIKNIIIHDGISGIGYGAFEYCKGVKSVIIPKSVKTIETYAFAMCQSLGEIIIPEGVISIGKYAFASCLSLKDVSLPDSLANLGEAAFTCTGIRRISLPTGLSSIENNTFMYCYELEELIIPTGVKSIGENAFYGCKLQELVVPNGVESIVGSFYDCSFLKSVYLPKSLKDATHAFYGCSSLTDVYFAGTEEELNAVKGWLIHQSDSWDYSDQNITYHYNYVKVVEGPEGTMYRLYNPNSGEHLYTADINETKYLASIGWNYENYAWQAPTSSNTPVYRVYNPNSGEHHYTSDTNEVSVLVSLGWNDEGIKFYSDDNQGTSMYRLYNPNATGQYEAGAHHYTKDVVERDYLTSIGWNAEGIGWYGL